MKKPLTPPCPCGSQRPLSDCCGPYLAGTAMPPSAEALMRSRYTAYTLGDAAYIQATWHPSTRPEQLALDEEPRPKWLGLEVKRHEAIDADHASVEFVARYKVGGRAHRMHEVSRFERVEGVWLYVDGEMK